MSQVSQAMRDHHRELAKTLQAQAEALQEGQSQANAEAFVKFLKTDLLPHAQGEEKSLYPVMDKLVSEHGRPTATMSVDHEFIGGYIKQVEQIARQLPAAKGQERANLSKQLARLAFKLETLFEVHLEKEERVYLPLMDKYLSSEEQQHVLDKMHEGAPEEQHV